MSTATLGMPASDSFLTLPAGTPIRGFPGGPLLSAVEVVPEYHYPAGSVDVPVYGSSVTAPTVYRHPGTMMLTVPYQAQPISPALLKKIFPMGAPSTFHPFQPPPQAGTPAPPAWTLPAAPAAPTYTIPATASTAVVATSGTAEVVEVSATKNKSKKKPSSKKRAMRCC